MLGTKSPLASEVRAIRTALRQLLRSFERLAPALVAAQTVNHRRPRRKMHLTPARRATLKLQGSYLGYMRQLNQTRPRSGRSARPRACARRSSQQSGWLIEGGDPIRNDPELSELWVQE